MGDYYRDVLVSAPTVEPVTLDEAKLHVRAMAGTDEDSLITSLIVAARRTCEAMLGQALITQTWDVLYDYGSSPFGFGMAGGGYYSRAMRQMGASPFWLPINSLPLVLPRPPLQSVTYIQYVDSSGNTQTLDPAKYIVSPGKPGRIQPVFGQAWPIPRPQIDAVTIRQVVGYGDTAADIDENIKAAMKLLVGHWYEHREEVTDGTPMTPVPTAVKALLSSSAHGKYY